MQCLLKCEAPRSFRDVASKYFDRHVEKKQLKPTGVALPSSRSTILLLSIAANQNP